MRFLVWFWLVATPWVWGATFELGHNDQTRLWAHLLADQIQRDVPEATFSFVEHDAPDQLQINQSLTISMGAPSPSGSSLRLRVDYEKLFSEAQKLNPKLTYLSLVGPAVSGAHTQRAIKHAENSGWVLGQGNTEETLLLWLSPSSAGIQPLDSRWSASPWPWHLDSVALGGQVDLQQLVPLILEGIQTGSTRATVNFDSIKANAMLVPQLTGALPEIEITWHRYPGTEHESHLIFWLLSAFIGLIGSGALAISRAKNVGLKRKLKFATSADALTQLHNREGFLKFVDAEINTPRTGTFLDAVVLVDIDRFQRLNETIGHQNCDLLLKMLSERLTTHLKDKEIAARLGADRFAVFMHHIPSERHLSERLQQMSENLGLPYVTGSQSLNLGISIGISHSPAHGNQAHSLISKAEIALASAKTHEEVSWSSFNARMAQQAERAYTLSRDLAGALKNDELRLVYQPIVDLSTHKLVGVEALLRWHHPLLGAIAPTQIISIARTSGLVNDLGDWVLKCVCQQAYQWHRNGSTIGVSVNVTAEQFASTNFVARVQRTLFEIGLLPSALTLEITEDATLETPELAEEALDRLADMGVKAAIDDFGTGYSSLSRLKRFRLSALKIDRSFVMDLASDANDQAINQAIIQIAKSMNMQVVAEGIETDEQLRMLTDEGCDFGQGYFFSRPVSAQQIGSLLEKTSWSRAQLA